MKKLSLLLGVLAIICFSNLTFSQLLFSEDFTGLTVGTLVPQSGWTEGPATIDLTVANTTPLTYTGYNGGGAEYVVMPVGNATKNRNFKLFSSPATSLAGNTFYFSYLLRLTATSASLASANNYFLTLGDAAGTTNAMCPKIFAATNGSGFNLGISKQSTTTIVWGTTVLNLNQTYLIVEKYVFNTLGQVAPANTDDNCYLWVNPNISSEPLISAAECNIPTGSLDVDFDAYNAAYPTGGIGSVIWNNRGVTNPAGAFDGIRVAYGTSSAAAWANLNAGGVTPVELTSFTAVPSKGAVNLSWNTATEVNNMGFNVERSANKTDWTNLAFVQGNQTSTKTHNYSYVDKSVSQSGNYYYRLKQVDNDGTFKYSSIAEVDVNSPSVFSLNQNYPNPFNPSTMISYSLPQATNVKLIVYNAIGQPIRVLENGFMNSGTYNVTFNASELSSGIYFCKIDAGQFSSIRKMMLLK